MLFFFLLKFMIFLFRLQVFPSFLLALASVVVVPRRPPRLGCGGSGRRGRRRRRRRCRGRVRDDAQDVLAGGVVGTASFVKSGIDFRRL